MTIGFGIIGLDHWYAALPFARRVATDPATRLVAVVDPDLDHAREAALGAAVDTDPDRVLGDPAVEVVAIFASVDRNLELCRAAADAGKHIVSVKPMAMTLAEADLIIDAVDAAGVLFWPSEARRSSPLARELSDAVSSGRLGELRSASFEMHSSLPKSWTDAPADGGWWVDPSRVPGGGWLDHAVYQLDRMHWLFGSPVAAITGVTGRIAHPDLAVEDYGHAVITLESGAVVTVEDTWLAAPGAFSNRAQLVGSNGSLCYDSTLGLLGSAGAGEPWSYRRLPEDSSDTVELVISSLRDGIRPEADARTARAVLATALDFYAAAEGR
ncbi:Gfo/Idh/MocA family protein [Microlunatus speluncae]|uniref:Gfo/Idh/MocA family protein n=1 Tax=Microlunatus speluncae TaxID=2594267 RepID=UPI001266865E|nr:Gfo/Idh/MocA family oxidoreductase [Microlunatus speluncae]